METLSVEETPLLKGKESEAAGKTVDYKRGAASDFPYLTGHPQTTSPRLLLRLGP